MKRRSIIVSVRGRKFRTFYASRKEAKQAWLFAYSRNTHLQAALPDIRPSEVKAVFAKEKQV